jgi:hypothetical protein
MGWAFEAFSVSFDEVETSLACPCPINLSPAAESLMLELVDLADLVTFVL